MLVVCVCDDVLGSRSDCHCCPVCASIHCDARRANPQAASCGGSQGAGLYEVRVRGLLGFWEVHSTLGPFVCSSAAADDPSGDGPGSCSCWLRLRLYQNRRGWPLLLSGHTNDPAPIDRPDPGQLPLSYPSRPRPLGFPVPIPAPSTGPVCQSFPVPSPVRYPAQAPDPVSHPPIPGPGPCQPPIPSPRPRLPPAPAHGPRLLPSLSCGSRRLPTMRFRCGHGRRTHRRRGHGRAPTAHCRFVFLHGLTRGLVLLCVRSPPPRVL